MKLVRAAWQAVAHGEVVVWPALGAGVTVAAVSIAIGPKRGDVRVDVAMASMAAFLFGVLLAFTIVRTRERLVLVQSLVAKGNAALLTVHDGVAVFDDSDRDWIRYLIDRHLTDQIDYRLADYHRASASFRELIQGVFALRTTTPEQDAVYKEMVARTFILDNDRALIEATAAQALSPLEWVGLLLLLLVLLGLLAVLPGGTILGSLVVGVMAVPLVMLMLLLRKLDLLRWHEQVTIWEPTTRLFRSMGQDPYVPRLVIDAGRYRPSGRIRVVDYPDPYPVRASKIVTVVDRVGPGSAPATAGQADAEPSRPLPGPGWYPDPHDPGFLRVWDGTAWTEQTMVRPLPSPEAQSVLDDA